MRLSDLSLDVNVNKAWVRQYESRPRFPVAADHSVYFGFCGFFHCEEHQSCMKQHVAAQSNVNASVSKQSKEKEKTSLFLVTVHNLTNLVLGCRVQILVFKVL